MAPSKLQPDLDGKTEGSLELIGKASHRALDLIEDDTLEPIHKDLKTQLISLEDVLRTTQERAIWAQLNQYERNAAYHTLENLDSQMIFLAQIWRKLSHSPPSYDALKGKEKAIDDWTGSKADAEQSAKAIFYRLFSCSQFLSRLVPKKSGQEKLGLSRSRTNSDGSLPDIEKAMQYSYGDGQVSGGKDTERNGDLNSDKSRTSVETFRKELSGKESRTASASASSGAGITEPPSPSLTARTAALSRTKSMTSQLTGLTLNDSQAELPEPDSTADRDQMTMQLYQACRRGDRPLISTLLQNGVDPNTPSPRWPPLCTACKHGHLQSVKLLLRSGASIALASDAQGWSALHTATKHDQRAIVSRLLSKGANPSARDSSGWRPLHVAARYGRFEIAQKLLGWGTELCAVDDQGVMPIELARRHGHQLVVGWLHDASLGYPYIADMRAWNLRTQLCTGMRWGCPVHDERARAALENEDDPFVGPWSWEVERVERDHGVGDGGCQIACDGAVEHSQRCLDRGEELKRECPKGL